MSTSEQDQPEHSVIGQPVARVDGRLKVIGQARYAAATALDNLVYGALILRAVPNRRVRAIDTTAREKRPGVLAVLTRANAPRLPNASMLAQQDMPQQGPIRRVMLLQEDTVWSVVNSTIMCAK